MEEVCAAKACVSAPVLGTIDINIGACGDRPLRNRKPPVWLKNFVFGGDFKQAHQGDSQLLSDSPTPHSFSVMAQQQLE